MRASSGCASQRRPSRPRRRSSSRSASSWCSTSCRRRQQLGSRSGCSRSSRRVARADGGRTAIASGSRATIAWILLLGVLELVVSVPVDRGGHGLAAADRPRQLAAALRVADRGRVRLPERAPALAAVAGRRDDRRRELRRDHGARDARSRAVFRGRGLGAEPDRRQRRRRLADQNPSAGSGSCWGSGSSGPCSPGCSRCGSASGARRGGAISGAVAGLGRRR